MDDAPRVSPEELKRRIDEGEDVVILDLRRGSWHRSDVKIPGAVRMELEEVDGRLRDLSPEASIVTYCT